MQQQPTDAVFPALLKSMDGRLLEVGNATVLPEEQRIEFHSEFVQLFKMDTPLRIVCLKNDVEILSFTGRVYLSSPQMLRLVGVRQQILPGAREVSVFPVNISATVRAVPADKQSLWARLVRRSAAEVTFTAEIYAISMGVIHFTASQLLREGQIIRMSAGAPPLEPLTLEVTQVFAFGDHNNYHCAVRTASAASLASLERYVTNLCSSRLSFFPEDNSNSN